MLTCQPSFDHGPTRLVRRRVTGVSDSQNAEFRVYVVDLVKKRSVRIEADEVQEDDDSGAIVFLKDGKEQGRYLQGQHHGYRDVTDEEIPFDPPFVLS